MKVAFVDQSAQMGGVEYTTLRIAKGLDKTRFDPIIICPEEGDLPYLARQSGVSAQIVPCPKFPSVSFQWGKRYFVNPFGLILSSLNVLRAAHNIENNLRKHSVDILITKGLLAHFYAGIAAKHLKIPCIWYMQEEVDSKRALGSYHYLLIRCARALPVKIVVDAEALLDQFNEIPQNIDMLRVINNGIDTNQFIPFSDHEKYSAKKAFQISDRSLVIGQAGRIIPLKGQDILLLAFSQLIQIYPDLHLLFVGAPLFGNLDFDNKLKSLVEQKNLTEHVTFTGFLPDVRQGLAAMDIFVNASIETDSPISILEAMACELAVVVSEVRGTEEMVEPNQDGLIFEPGNSTNLALQLERVISSEQLRHKLGTKARESIIERFSLEKSIEQLQELLEELREK